MKLLLLLLVLVKIHVSKLHLLMKFLDSFLVFAFFPFYLLFLFCLVGPFFLFEFVQISSGQWLASAREVLDDGAEVEPAVLQVLFHPVENLLESLHRNATAALRVSSESRREHFHTRGPSQLEEKRVRMNLTRRLPCVEHRLDRLELLRSDVNNVSRSQPWQLSKPSFCFHLQ
jgi:hypothetical protein